MYLSGLKIARIGNSSLTYHTAIFAAKNDSAPFNNGDLVLGHFKDETNIKARVLDHFEDSSCCTGEYIHVFVNPNNGNKPCNISEEWRKVLKRLTWKCVMIFVFYQLKLLNSYKKSTINHT